VHAQGARLFLARPKFNKLQLGKKKHKVSHVLNKMLWLFTTSAHTRCRLFLAPTSTEKASYILRSVSQWRPRAEQKPFAQIDFRRQGLRSCFRRQGLRSCFRRQGLRSGLRFTPVLASVNGCWRGLLVNLYGPTPFGQIDQGYLRRDLCVGILLHLR